MTIFDTPQFTPLGATGLLVRFGDAIDRDLSLRIAALIESIERERAAGLVDLIPSYTTLIVLFDPETTHRDQLIETLVSRWDESAESPDTDYLNSQEIEIPVVYGGETGPDLKDVASATGLSPDEVVRRHSGGDYTVGALGFAPGFAFLIGLPPELAVPRRASPRTRVPAGSVGIGGAQTGIYSLPTPGGWSLIGRTWRKMFDPNHESSSDLRIGDRVRFVPVGADDAEEFSDERSVSQPDGSTQDGSLEVVEAGVQTSVQDLGRPGQGRAGITPGGALDRSALIAGNRLLGNPDDAAEVEWTLLPPVLRFREACQVVMTGADPSWELNGAAVAIGDVTEVAPGDELRARPAREMLGARGYICGAGGIDVPVVRGSRALDLSAGFGGGYGRPLQKGDRLRIGEETDNPGSGKRAGVGDSADPSSTPFRVVRGPQADRFDERAWSTFLSERFEVDAQSNRMGLRLNGPAVPPQDGADVISEGIVTGAIQVTGSGQPIVLLPGRATIGGYTKIATVIEADHDRLGQLRPGSTIRFVEVSIEQAEAELRRMRPSVHGGLHAETSGESVMTDDPKRDTTHLPSGRDGWTPDGVIRVIRALADHDVQAFSLRVEAAGLEIAIDRGGGLPGRPGRTHDYQEADTRTESIGTEEPDNPLADEAQAITAPLLGTFYRRPSPEEPTFVEEGDKVEEGQTVGLIEVMKTFHEVTAGEPGVVRRVLVEDGAIVEFGETLMELDPAPEG